jgi:hypothetical protein
VGLFVIPDRYAPATCTELYASVTGILTALLDRLEHRSEARSPEVAFTSLATPACPRPSGVQVWHPTT